MNQRQNEDLNKYIFDDRMFKIYIALEKKLSKYLELLNRLYETKGVKYTVMVVKASEKSIKETVSNIRKTDIFFKIPYTQTGYVIILQNTDCRFAIEYGSQLTGLINRAFMINKKEITHKVSLISFESKPPKIVDVCYEIVYNLKKFKEIKTNDFWVEIKRF